MKQQFCQNGHDTFAENGRIRYGKTKQYERCRLCRNEEINQWRKNNPEKYNKMRRTANAKVANYINEKKDNPCTDCGIKYHRWAMEFDHVRGAKEFAISQARSEVSLEKLKAELAKCELVCANCHRIRTHARRQKLHKQLDSC
jgi:hypothetical protein